MVAQAVGLDDQFHRRPEEVDLEPVDHLLGLREREIRFQREREKEAFELLVREHEGVPVEQGAERADTGLSVVGGCVL